jgi:hypothetical protein
MTEITANPQTDAHRSLKNWLLNPFMFTAGFPALALGIAVMLISALACWLGSTHFDGVLDLHTGLPGPFWILLSEGILDWLCLAIPLILLALLISKSRFRIIDLLGTQALARFPYFIAALAMLPDANRRAAQYFIARVQGSPATLTVADTVVFTIAILITILAAIWMIILMYKSYAVSCNLKGPKAIVTFILGLIIAEIASKLFISLLIAGRI